jgi:xanthine dehydrogenase accessory factor
MVPSSGKVVQKNPENHMNDRALFRQIASALEHGQPAALVTVTATTGSTPGKVGYKMAVFDQGRESAGTVGGGLVEAQMIEQARTLLGQPGARWFRFELGSTPADDKGICGGSVELLVETFDETALPLFQELSLAADGEAGGVLVSLVSPDGPARKLRLANAVPVDPATGTEFPPETAAAIKEAARTGGTGVRASAGAVEVFVESLAPAPTVFLFGAGHVASHIARYARSVHFRIVVCDERREYANRARFSDAEELIVADFAHVFERLRIDRNSYLVIVTRGHECDAVVLEQAVRTEARYIGMIGSRRKTRLLLETLRHKGVPQALLDKVYSPVGVSIGAVTAEEIALSIVCELVKVRRLGDAAPIGHLSIAARGADL